MAHEVNDDAARKKQLDMENGRPVAVGCDCDDDETCDECDDETED